MALTRPSIMSDGDTQSAPASACARTASQGKRCALEGHSQLAQRAAAALAGAWKRAWKRGEGRWEAGLLACALLLSSMDGASEGLWGAGEAGPQMLRSMTMGRALKLKRRASPYLAATIRGVHEAWGGRGSGST